MNWEQILNGMIGGVIFGVAWSVGEFLWKRRKPAGAQQFRCPRCNGPSGNVLSAAVCWQCSDGGRKVTNIREEGL